MLGPRVVMVFPKEGKYFLGARVIVGASADMFNPLSHL
jgi:hypothetical protein